MDSRRPSLPYFMEYQIPRENINNTEQISDRDYFRQMYPKVVKRYIRVITDVLDRMDIRESYIYDEYPDKIRLERLTEIILQLIPMEKNMNRRLNLSQTGQGMILDMRLMRASWNRNWGGARSRHLIQVL